MAASLFQQSLADVEYIFVDDCSEDCTAQLLETVIDRYPHRKDQVRILKNTSKMGASQSRRIGVEQASGEFILLADADDWMASEALEHLYNAAKDNDADGAACDVLRKLTDGSIINEPPFCRTGSGSDCREEMLGNVLSARGIQSLWRYLFKASLYENGIRFPVHFQGDDIALVLQLLYYSRKMVYVPEVLYHWNYRPVQKDRKPDVEKSLQRFNESTANTELMLSFAKEKGLDNIYKDHIIELKRYSRSLLSEALKMGTGVSLWASTFPEINRQVAFCRHSSLRHKVQFYVTLLRRHSWMETMYQLVTGHKRRWGQ